MTLEYAKLGAKMREIAERDDLGKMVGKNRVIEDETGLFEAAMKELSAPLVALEESGCSCEVKEGEKCPHDMIELMPKPLGGSTSFSDHDEYQDAIDTEMHVKELGYIFRMLVDNIFDNEEMSLPQKADAVVAAATELSSRVKAPPEGRRSLLDRMKDMVKGAFANKEGADPQLPKRAGFVSYKDAQGIWRWLIVNTNKYEDREGEIFSEKSHKEYIHFVEKTGHWPELWLWHTPGTRIGVASAVDYVDGFVVHSGKYDKGMEDVAENLSKMLSELGVSHGYEYLVGDEEDKVYDHYRTFELTICPADRAANIWGTEFETFTKEVTMGFSKDKREFFVGILGEERVVDLETKLPALGKELESRGVNFKDLVDSLIPDAEAEGEEDPPKAEGEGDPPKAEGDPPKAEGDPPKAEGGESESKPEVKTSVEDRMVTVEGLLVKLGATLDQQAADQKNLVEGIGDRIASGLDEALTGRKRPPNGDKRPSQAKETEITEEAAEEAAKVKGPGEGTHPQARALVNDLMNRGNVPQG